MDHLPNARVSAAAVACAACAAVSAGGYMFSVLALAALPAIIFGVVALAQIRRYSLVGRRLVTVALPMSVTIALWTAAIDIALYRSEAPAGYERVRFEPDLDEYVGQRICLKGYTWDQNEQGKELFSLSPNGSYRDFTRIIVVEIAEGVLTEWTWDALAVSGRLERLPEVDENGPRYVLRDAHVRDSRTSYDLAPRSNADGC